MREALPTKTKTQPTFTSLATMFPATYFACDHLVVTLHLTLQCELPMPVLEHGICSEIFGIFMPSMFLVLSVVSSYAECVDGSHSCWLVSKKWLSPGNKLRSSSDNCKRGHTKMHMGRQTEVQAHTKQSGSPISEVARVSFLEWAGQRRWLFLRREVILCTFV